MTQTTEELWRKSVRAKVMDIRSKTDREDWFLFRNLCLEVIEKENASIKESGPFKLGQAVVYHPPGARGDTIPSSFELGILIEFSYSDPSFGFIRFFPRNLANSEKCPLSLLHVATQEDFVIRGLAKDPKTLTRFGTLII